MAVRKINDVNDLQIGDIVFKAYEPGDSGYDLPSRYKNGGTYYDGDLKDYYHVGVVTSVRPLHITHMTTPTVKVDTKLGKWGYYGKLSYLVDAGKTTGYDKAVSSFLDQIDILKSKNLRYQKNASGENGECDCIGLIIGALRGMGIRWEGIHGSNFAARKRIVQNGEPTPGPSPEPAPKPSTGTKAIVTAESGRWVKMRAEPKTSCRLYEEIPVGAEVTIVSPGEVWAKIDYGRRKGWYMMAKFLKIEDSQKSEIPDLSPVIEPKLATVFAKSGKSVKMRKKPSLDCRYYDDVPIGSTVVVEEIGEKWSKISYGIRKGWYMQTSYLKFEEEKGNG